VGNTRAKWSVFDINSVPSISYVFIYFVGEMAQMMDCNISVQRLMNI